MTREETDRLFELLAIFRPGDKHLENKPLRAAWQLVLEPYQAADVKQAVAAYFRECKFWPDVTDISVRCPSPVENSYRNRAAHSEENREFSVSVERYKDLFRRRREAGLPETADAAVSSGMTRNEWYDAIEKVGLLWTI